MKQAVYITGNQHKADYLAKLLDLPIEHQKVDLDELQSLDLKTVVEHKARQAYSLIKKPVLVEDTSLEFHALGGLPGAFVRFFVDHTGLQATCQMLDGFTDRSATARCGYGYFDGEQFHYFEGSVEGSIAKTPSQGKAGFGWDRIFISKGYGGRIRADLSEAEYDELYLRLKPIEKVKEFLSS